ncbi:c6 zinc finger domain containing protein [Grosmannia clavigera kw1407]|uniref:C6 zinc finger domain containing protein n=1 Tax=Grosmannia clavigera (strain kw1407 / UAMH 11150) TaxID=655863 RepID=F0XAY0_GROCL|nr:c6 zinc finger domain containing protein [Grosmannia clavigera kw1407]EFX05181.1 c6 zinc finger domain containing protein [Grosmannia clavigera kw1407]
MDQRAAKVGHRKSRKGCSKCKIRRVKGDADVFLVPESVADEFSLPESRARRLMEHRLMQNYILHLSEPLPMSPSAEWNALWQKQLPPLALQHDNLLYALLAMSATSLLGAGEDESRKGDEHGSGDSSGSSSETSSGNSGSGSNVERKELFTVRQAYLIAAMGEQRRMVQSLTLASADAVCLSSLLMLINAFAMLGERVVQPYTPPTEWLQLGRGSGAVVWLSVEAIQQSGEADRSVMCTIANAPPQFGLDESYFDASNREQFGALLATEATTASASEPSDPDDETTRLAYEQTLAYVGSIYKAIRRREPVYVISRRVQGFTMVVPPRFVDLVAASRPRALVVLAYFFAAVVQLSGVWWLGEGAGAGRNCIARRELRGIRSVLPDEWTGLMVWPLDIAGLM